MFVDRVNGETILSKNYTKCFTGNIIPIRKTNRKIILISYKIILIELKNRWMFGLKIIFKLLVLC